jgi:CMP-N-acetylneuraminic acid synthetase
MSLDGDRLVHREPGAPTRRQDKTTLYARNGPAVLAVRSAGLAARGLYGGDLRAYVMDARSSLDVDAPFDLEVADLLLRRPEAV